MAMHADRPGEDPLRPASDTRSHDPAPERSAASLLGDLARQIPDLFRKETQLLRTELSEKTNQAFAAIGMIVGGVVLALTSLIVLSFALVAALENAGIAPGWAALIVGGALALIALALASKGRNDLKASSLAPERTMHSVRKDADVAKQRV
jgi:hypothetical protein